MHNCPVRRPIPSSARRLQSCISPCFPCSLAIPAVGSYSSPLPAIPRRSSPFILFLAIPYTSSYAEFLQRPMYYTDLLLVKVPCRTLYNSYKGILCADVFLGTSPLFARLCTSRLGFVIIEASEPRNHEAPRLSRAVNVRRRHPTCASPEARAGWPRSDVSGPCGACVGERGLWRAPLGRYSNGQRERNAVSPLAAAPGAALVGPCAVHSGGHSLGPLESIRLLRADVGSSFPT